MNPFENYKELWLAVVIQAGKDLFWTKCLPGSYCPNKERQKVYQNNAIKLLRAEARRFFFDQSTQWRRHREWVLANAGLCLAAHHLERLRQAAEEFERQEREKHDLTYQACRVECQRH